MNEMRYYLLTGADGNLGGKLAKLICDQTDHGVIAVSSFPERIPAMIERERIIQKNKILQYSSDAFFAADLRGMNVDGVVHFAFSRAIFPNQDIASSLDYSLAAFQKVVRSDIQNAIYISSQSVYGDTEDWRMITTPPAPNSIYAMAKYGGEKLFEAAYDGHDDLQHTVLRLDIVVQSQNLVSALCRDAKQKGKLTLKGGQQVFSYLDISDVPNAVLRMLEFEGAWKPIYNVGQNRVRYTLMDIAEAVQAVAKKNNVKVDISLERNDTRLWAGMDTSDFIRDTGWEPTKTLEDMICSIYQNA